MCGIAGYFGFDIPNDKNIEECSKTLNHRGPDGCGVFRKKNHNNKKGIVLLHTRLAILDIDQRSNQPFRIGNKLLIFNGEIYNYIEIRKKLESIGYSFITTGDTEVLAKSLNHWGTKAFDYLEGMWAFAWFDLDENQLILSRDRFGEKPLYYYKNKDGLYFASEIKGIFSLLG